MHDFLSSIHYNGWVLPALLAIPLVGALVLLAMASSASDDGTLEAAPAARWVALITFLVELVVSIGLWWSFDPGTAGWQARVTHWWIPAWGAQFDVGIDGMQHGIRDFALDGNLDGSFQELVADRHCRLQGFNASDPLPLLVGLCDGEGVDDEHQQADGHKKNAAQG